MPLSSMSCGASELITSLTLARAFWSISSVCASMWMYKGGLSGLAKLRSGYQVPLVVREAPVSWWIWCCVGPRVMR